MADEYVGEDYIAKNKKTSAKELSFYEKLKAAARQAVPTSAVGAAKFLAGPTGNMVSVGEGLYSAYKANPDAANEVNRGIAGKVAGNIAGGPVVGNMARQAFYGSSGPSALNDPLVSEAISRYLSAKAFPNPITNIALDVYDIESKKPQPDLAKTMSPIPSDYVPVDREGVPLRNMAEFNLGGITKDPSGKPLSPKAEAIGKAVTNLKTKLKGGKLEAMSGKIQGQIQNLPGVQNAQNVLTQKRMQNLPPVIELDQPQSSPGTLPAPKYPPTEWTPLPPPRPPPIGMPNDGPMPEPEPWFDPVASQAPKRKTYGSSRENTYRKRQAR